MKVTVWNHSEIIDIAAHVPMYNYICFKKPAAGLIDPEPVTIGEFNFIPGKEYEQIGFYNKTSSGYTFYQGEPIVYNGRFEDYILFSLKSGEIDGKDQGYENVFFGFRLCSEINCLFTLNHAGAGRIIEMTKGKRKNN